MYTNIEMKLFELLFGDEFPEMTEEEIETWEGNQETDSDPYPPLSHWK